MDIVTDGFGFMLAVGDLLFVPFTYSLQARYLAFHPVELGPLWVVAILATNILGYYIFRTANGEKDDFRNGRNPKSTVFFSFPFQRLYTESMDRPPVYGYSKGNQAAYFGLVGTVSSPKLLVSLHLINTTTHTEAFFPQWRSYYGPRMVSTDRFQYAHHLLLRDLFCNSARPPTKT